MSFLQKAARATNLELVRIIIGLRPGFVLLLVFLLLVLLLSPLLSLLLVLLPSLLLSNFYFLLETSQTSSFKSCSLKSS